MKYTTYPDCTPSPAEELIISAMTDRDIYFEREVSFEGLTNPETGAPLRYDFYLPEHNTIIEYDGVAFHQDAAIRARDEFKNKFAAANRIRLIRIQGIGNISLFFNDELGVKIKDKTGHTKIVKSARGSVVVEKKRVNLIEAIDKAVKGMSGTKKRKIGGKNPKKEMRAKATAQKEIRYNKLAASLAATEVNKNIKVTRFIGGVNKRAI